MLKQKLNVSKQTRNNEIDETGIFPIPEQYTHSIKVSDTARGIRVDIHVYTTDRVTAVEEALQTYMSTKDEAEKFGLVMAPVDSTNSKDKDTK